MRVRSTSNVEGWGAWFPKRNIVQQWTELNFVLIKRENVVAKRKIWFRVHLLTKLESSVVYTDPNWIHIQELCASKSVFRVRIRIHTGENRIDKLDTKSVRLKKNPPFRDLTDKMFLFQKWQHNPGSGSGSRFKNYPNIRIRIQIKCIWIHPLHTTGRPSDGGLYIVRPVRLYSVAWTIESAWINLGEALG